jgi:hypothetical protein
MMVAFGASAAVSSLELWTSVIYTEHNMSLVLALPPYLIFEPRVHSSGVRVPGGAPIGLQHERQETLIDWFLDIGGWLQSSRLGEGVRGKQEISCIGCLDDGGWMVGGSVGLLLFTV